MPYDDDGQWIEPSYEDEDPAVEEGVPDDDNLAGDLAEAEARLGRKEAGTIDGSEYGRLSSAQFQELVERSKRGLISARPEDAGDSSLARKLAELPPGDPKFDALKVELLAISADREADRKAAQASPVGPVGLEEPALTWDARDLSPEAMKALTAAAKGGSREPPAGYLASEWRAFLRSAGIG